MMSSGWLASSLPPSEHADLVAEEHVDSLVWNANDGRGISSIVAQALHVSNDGA